MSKLSVGDVAKPEDGEKQKDTEKKDKKIKDGSQNKSKKDKASGMSKDNGKSEKSSLSNFKDETIKNTKRNFIDDQVQDKTNVDTKALRQSLKIAKKAVPIVQKTVMMAYLMDLLLKLQMLMMSALTALSSGVSGFLGWILNIGLAIQHGFQAAVGFVANLLSVPTMAATLIVGAVPITGGVSAIAIFNSVNIASNLIDDVLIDCKDSVFQIMADAEGEAVNPSEETLKNAKVVYSIFKGYGLSDIQIAGILGNWSEESGVDFTGVEGIYDEPFNANGPKKSAAMMDMHNYCLTSLFPKYDNRKPTPLKINKNAYRGSNGKYMPGIGIAGFTGPATEKLLNTARQFNKNWYDLDLQLAYAIMGYRKGYFEKMKTSPETTTIEGAVRHFLRDYEGSVKLFRYDIRLANAMGWLAKIQAEGEAWLSEEDSINLTNSALSMIGEMGSIAITEAINSAKNNCVQTINTNNSSLAMAAISIAHTSMDLARDKGTNLFEKLVDTIFPGTTLRQSCDLTMAVVMRWSGGDASYLKGSTANQYDDLLASKKWKLVGEAKDLSYKDLLPGDVFITPKRFENGMEIHGHTFMFVGRENVLSVHKDLTTGVDTVEGSYGSFSPVLTKNTSYVMSDKSGEHGYDYLNGVKRYYKVFRLIEPDNDKTYSDIRD